MHLTIRRRRGGGEEPSQHLEYSTSKERREDCMTWGKILNTLTADKRRKTAVKTPIS